MNRSAITIDTSLVQQLLAAQFPHWAGLRVRPVESGGWDNRTFHLGDDMTVRLPSAAAYSSQVDKEHRWLPRLAPSLPLAIPHPLAMGLPAHGYPWHWSVYRWLDGETASTGRIDDLSQFATTLAEFLIALQRIDITHGAPPGPHNFFRGGSLFTYDEETRLAISTLSGHIDTGAATEVWETALSAPFLGPAVWVHGDISAGNLLVTNGRLNAVIDFGCLAVGDPACDLSIAWTLFEHQSRQVFRKTLPLDPATWARGRGWTLWKALIVLAELPGTNPLEIKPSRRILDEVLADHQQHSGLAIYS